MRSAGKLVTATLVAVQIVLMWIALREGQVGDGPPTAPVTPATIPIEALTIETALPLADPVALAWDDDAVLVSASMEVIWDRDAAVTVPSTIADSGALTLVYAGGDRQLSLLMDRGSGVIFHAEEGEWSDELAIPLPVSAIVRSSAISVLAAEVSYGTSYRAACPEYRFVTRVYLSRSADSAANPVWLVSYVDERHRDRPDIQIAVDAVTGRTVDGEAMELGCPEV